MQEFARYTGYDYNGSYHYILKWELLSQNQSENYSEIKLQAVIETNVGYISWDSGSAKLDGDWFELSKTYYRGSTIVREKTKIVKHNDDGTLKINIGGSIDTTYVMKGSCSGEIELPKINRYAVIKSFTGDTLDGDLKATYDKYVDSYNYKLRVVIPNVKELEVRQYKSGEIFKLTSQSLSEIYKYAEGKDKVSIGASIQTFNGNTKLGESSTIVREFSVQSSGKIYINGSWKKLVPYIFINGGWKKASTFIRVNNQWKRGN